jgi:acyl-CoA thioester hydrolase
VSLDPRVETFWLDMRVYYEDTDAAGVVYYANYLRYMERVRTEWMSSLGMDPSTMQREHRVAFAVHRVDIEYLRPARLGDRLRAGVTLRERGRSRIILDQHVVRGDDILTRAGVTLACLEPVEWKPVRMPAALVSRLANVNS